MASVREVLLRAAQWMDLGAVLIAAGAGIFLHVVWRRSSAERPASVEAAFVERWRRIVVVSWVVAVVASIPLTILEGAIGVEGLRLGLLLFAGLIWLGPIALGPGALRRSRVVPPLLGTMALVALLLSAALSGHARGSSLPVPNVLVALIHVAAAAAWVGGLVALVAVAFPAARDQVEADRASILAPVVARFSDLAVLSVLAIVASGIYSAWMEIGTLRAVTTSNYGLIFLAKLAAFLPVLALGGINNRWTKPRLVRAVRDRMNARASLLLLRRLVALEIGMIAVVLALTVLLLQLSPPVTSGGGA
jgi:copper transport protein